MTYQDVIAHFGSQGAAARALGLKQPSVWAWKVNGIPELRQLDIERKTNGKLKADAPKQAA